MGADCQGCASARVVPGARARLQPRARSPWLVLVSGLLAALLPKCPLCLAAYLSLFGITVGAASVALAVLRPLAVALAVLGLALMVRRWARR
jgi:hypothetical protein